MVYIDHYVVDLSHHRAVLEIGAVDKSIEIGQIDIVNPGIAVTKL